MSILAFENRISDVLISLRLSAWFLLSVCKMNVHIRCRGNVAPSCGVNSVELANKLAEMGLQAGGISKRNSMVQMLSSSE